MLLRIKDTLNGIGEFAACTVRFFRLSFHTVPSRQKTTEKALRNMLTSPFIFGLDRVGFLRLISHHLRYIIIYFVLIIHFLFSSLSPSAFYGALFALGQIYNTRAIVTCSVTCTDSMNLSMGWTINYEPDDLLYHYFYPFYCFWQYSLAGRLTTLLSRTVA